MKISLISFLLLALFISCNQQETQKSSQEDVDRIEASSEDEVNEFPSSGNLVKVTSTAMDFQVDEKIPSGWTTFRYYNNSPVTHFFSLSKLPVVDGEQKTAQDEADEAGDIYGEALELINEGNRNEAFSLLQELPEWASEKIHFGGVGMLSPHGVGQTDIYLEPGVYLMECYVKTGGEFHALMGMYANITVTEDESEASPPESTLQMNISTENGFEIDEDIEPGRHVLEVYFEDQVNENGSGHDVHLVKLTENSQLEKLENWMVWTTPQGMNTPAPAGEFLGGVQNLRAGETGYMTVDLTPGEYAWISEGSDLSSRNLLKQFTVINK